MTAPGDPAGLPLGESHFAAGWRQGSVCSSTALAFAFNELQPESGDVSVQRRNVKPSESLVIISQDCDILSANEPYVEAMICRTVKADFVRQVDRNSARWFVLDPASRLIAEAKYRLAIDKKVLATLAPTPWPGDDLRFRRFVRWLGRRYDRPALPDALVDCLQKPLTAALEALERDDPGMMAVFSQAIHEIRVTEPDTEEPPFKLSVYLMARGDAITDVQARAIDQVATAIQNASDRDQVAIVDVMVRFEEEMSIAEYFRTRPLFLEYLTYLGDELAGAEPSPPSRPRPPRRHRTAPL